MEISSGLARQMIEHLSMPVCWLDRKGVVHFANPAFLKLVDRPSYAAPRLVLTEFFSHKSGTDWEDSHRRVLEGTLVEDRGLLELAEGEVHVDVVFSPLGPGDEPLVALTIARVCPEPPADAEQLPLKQGLDDAALSMLLNDRSGRILFANRAACRLLGYSLEELRGCRVTDIDAEYDMPELRRIVRGKQERGEEATFQTRHRRKDGSTYFAEVSVHTSRSKYQDYIFVFFRDITELREQRTLHEQLGFLVENSSDAVYIFDENLDIVYANLQAERLTGYTRHQLKGMNFTDLDPAHAGEAPQTFIEMAARGERIVFESEHKTRAKALVPVEVSLAYSIFDGQVHISAFVRDIRDRKEYLREMEQMRFALENSSDAVYLYDRRGNIHYANWSACERLGYSREELLRMNVSELDPRFSPEENDLQWDDLAAKNRPPLETAHRRKDGSSYPVEVLVSATTVQGGDYAVAFVRDISERLLAQKALREGEERFRLIADTSPVALIISRVSDGRIRYANRQAAVLLHRSLEKLYTSNLVDLLRQGGVEQEVLNLITLGKPLVNREIHLSQNEGQFWVSLNTSTMELQGELVMGCLMLDVTEAKELSNQLSYHATYDDLTGLVNRREFEDRLQEVIEIARKRRTENALCYLDLDQFKIINDTCGHMAGDELLRQLAEVLYQCVRRDDTLARLGGDEFAILLEMCSLENAEAVANKVRQAVQEFRFMWQGKTFNISVSIGLVPIAPEGETISEVLRRADTACYAAKDAGRNRIHIFRFDDQELAQRHGEMQWVTRITSALDHGRLELWKQKIVPTREGLDSGEHFELLVRLRDERGALILPGAFLPAAERYDLASRIDRWVINETFDWLARNPHQVARLGTCAINLSGRTLSDAEFLNEVTQRFRASGVPPGKLCFEITETAAIANLSRATAFMRTLKSLGCMFALDDFGSGLSSFAYLKNLPVDYVKIDGFFVKDVTTDPIDLAMVKAINDMAHAMGKLTIAEFVEDEQILGVLIGLGVDYVQGYGIARPTPLLEETAVESCRGPHP